MQFGDQLLKRAQRSHRASDRCSGDEFFDGGPERSSVRTSGFPQRIHGSLADAARRHIQYAQQRNVIFRMHRQPHVGQRVFDFGAIVEAESSDQFVAQAAAAKDLFECARLEICPVLDGAGLCGVVVQNPFQFSRHEFRFGLGVARFKIAKIRARAFRRAQRLAQSFRIVRDHRASRIQNILRGAIVSLQLHDSRAGKVARKTQQNRDVRAAPAVDGLVFIADDTQVVFRPSQQPQQVVLHAVGVLILVDVDVLKTGLPLFAHCRHFSKQAHRAQQKIVKIERIALMQQLFVGRKNIRDAPAVLADGLAAQHLGSLRVIFCVADAAEDIPRRKAVVIDRQLAHGELHGGELVVVIVNCEISRQACARRFPSQKPCAQGVKRRKPGLRGRHSRAKQQIGHARAHLLRGLVGESDCEDRVGRHALGNQIGHAERDGARLARSCSGKNQHGTFYCFCGEALFRIQFVEEIQHLPAVVEGYSAL